MLPHRLNLLSPGKVLHLKKMINFQFIKNLLEIILFFFCLSGITLLGGQIILQDYFYQVVSQTVAVSSRYANTNKEIRDINIILEKINRVSKEYYSWSETIVEISNVLPNQVVLSGLIINKTNQHIIINGTAINREALLSFRDRLDSLNLGKPIEIPPAQLTAQENINFSFTINLK